ncbi:MAG: LysE family translocator [Alphaproteobacteria bacterium]
MDWHVWGLFAAAELAFCLTPGPAVLLIVATGLSRGWRATVWTNLGVLAANAMYFAISATGLGAIVAASHDVFVAVKWAGAAYLVWLGVQALRGAGDGAALAPGPDAVSGGGRRLFANGFLLQAANPKALLFFTAFLPQFIDPAGSVALQVLILGLTSVAIEFWTQVGYGALAGRANRWMHRPAVARAAHRITGGILIGAGAGLAAVAR